MRAVLSVLRAARRKRSSRQSNANSAGFWPGNAETPPIFYAYAYPTPDGFSEAPVRPDAAFWLDALGEFALPYEAVAKADDPDACVMASPSSRRRPKSTSSPPPTG